MMPCKVVEVQWELKSANPFGDVSWAAVYLDTWIRTGTVARHDFTHPRDREGRFNQSLYLSGTGGTTLHPCTAIMDDEDSKGGRVVIAVMGTSVAEYSWTTHPFLLLQPADPNASEYQRVGVATARVCTGIHRVIGTERWERWTIKIV